MQLCDPHQSIKNGLTTLVDRILEWLPCKLCGSRKYPYPHHGGNGKFQGGGGVKVPGNSRGDGGKRRNFHPEGRKSIDFLRMSIGATCLL